MEKSEIKSKKEHSIIKLFSEMKEFPTSFFLYFVPAAILMYMLTYITSFYNLIGLYTKEELITFIITISSYLLLFYLIDSFVAHFSYTQYSFKSKKFNSKISQISHNLKSALKTYHIYVIQRALLLMIMFSPIIVFILFSQLISFLQFYAIGDVWIILLLILLLSVSLLSFLLSIYLSMTYAYLPVSVHFSKNNNLIKFNEYRTIVKKNKKNILIKILMLIGLVVLFQIVYWIYSSLISFIPQSIVLLFFQAIGVCITMTISYFSNTYLFFTYKENISKIKK